MSDSELVAKWLATGFLRGVKKHNLQHVAERLDEANRRSFVLNNRNVIDLELRALEREGLINGR